MSGTRITLMIPSLKSPALSSELKRTVVLIDDDVLVRFNWKRQGEIKNIQVHSFESLEAFLEVRSLFSETTPIFIDSNLGHEKGELLSEKLYELGFMMVYLTTGLPKESILNTKWITGVVCKSFESAVLPKLQNTERV